MCGDIAPGLKPGKSWSKFETPDHSFDQSRVNAVTLMTHLFIDTPKLTNVDLNIMGTDTVINVTRTGKAITLINLSLSEPETVFRIVLFDDPTIAGQVLSQPRNRTTQGGYGFCCR